MDTGGVWIRHPSDAIIPDSEEYKDYTTYNVDAPVGRVVVPTAESGTVVPGTDVVVCISCHVSHGSDHPDLLRWDYSQIIAGVGNNDGGCFICHTTKDE
jgi:predicted CXXCH cytochrome family protein